MSRAGGACAIPALALLSLGCSGSGWSQPPCGVTVAALEAYGPTGRGGPYTSESQLRASPLQGPFPSRDATCSALVNRVAVERGSKPLGCASASVVPGPGAPFAAVEVLWVQLRPAPQASDIETGAYFLAVAGPRGWFVTTRPVDMVSSGAGHTFLPTITPLGAEVAETPAGARVLVRLRDTITAVRIGDQASAPAAETTRDLVLACARDPELGARCTDPIEVDIGATVELSTEDTLVVKPPVAGPPRAYTLVF